MGDSKFIIESEDVTIAELYKDFYAVPDFQREYVWNSKEVEKLLTDISDEFYDGNGNIAEGPEYFLGSIVVCRDKDGTYQLIDGQQRMTTFFLILCVIRDLLYDQYGPASVLDTLKMQIAVPKYDTQTRREKKIHRLVLQYEESDGILAKLGEDHYDIDSITPKTRSADKILTAYREIWEILSEQTSQGDGDKLKDFYYTFTTRVKLIRICAPDLSKSLKVFETINDRGVGLNSVDLLKNLLFIETDSKLYSKLKTKWKEFIDLIDRNKEKPLRFLRYYIMANYIETAGKKEIIREENIYDWFCQNKEKIGLTKNPLDFMDTLYSNAQAYTNFLNGQNVDGTENEYLNNLTILSGAIRQHFILLLAAKDLEKNIFSELVKEIENLFFCFFVIQETTRSFELDFLSWVPELKKVNSMEAVQLFINDHIYPFLRSRAERFDFAFEQITEDHLVKYRIKYILAKLAQFIDKNAWQRPTHASLGYYYEKNIDIEHILSQTPAGEIEEPKEKYCKYVAKLGNLTLLEKTINTSISNGCFSLKKAAYRQSSFLLTKSIAERPVLGENTSLNRAVEGLIPFDDWNYDSIDKRQSMLKELAKQIWNIPPRTDISS